MHRKLKKNRFELSFVESAGRTIYAYASFFLFLSIFPVRFHPFTFVVSSDGFGHGGPQKTVVKGYKMVKLQQ